MVTRVRARATARPTTAVTAVTDATAGWTPMTTRRRLWLAVPVMAAPLANQHAIPSKVLIGLTVVARAAVVALRDRRHAAQPLVVNPHGTLMAATPPTSRQPRVGAASTPMPVGVAWCLSPVPVGTAPLAAWPTFALTPVRSSPRSSTET